ncbi:MAG: hypothetical protein OXG79_04965 [Chloroflexi bacterium]|nr:hypothetical protein [Chloroflexota bacterium]
MIAKTGRLADVDATVLEDALAEIETLTAHLSPDVQDSVAKQFVKAFGECPTLSLERKSAHSTREVIARVQLPDRCREILAAVRAGEVERVVLIEFQAPTGAS